MELELQKISPSERVTDTGPALGNWRPCHSGVFPSSSPPLPLLPIRSMHPLNPARGSRGELKLPSWVRGGGAPAEIEFRAF